MNYGGRILSDMKDLTQLFAAHCSDRETLDELAQALDEPARWSKAHALFDRIRKKQLRAERENASVLSAQYRFEEICAKTIYNLSNRSAPFDADSPYWIVPHAISLARELRIGETPILQIVAG